MILKCKRGLNDDNVWVLFDGADKVTYKEIEENEPIVVSEIHEDLTIPKYNKPKDTSKGDCGIGPMKEIWMYKNKQAIRQILAYSPIFILNDEGKTIERI